MLNAFILILAFMSEFEVFFISIDVYLCETDKLLSKNWKALSNEGLGYYLESVKIILSIMILLTDLI